VSARAYLELVRAPALLTAPSNILAAYFVATGGHGHAGDLPWLCLASLGLYAGGMVLNDCFDLAEDRRERPGRPLPSGRVPVRLAWALGLALLGTGVLLAFAAGITTGLIALGVAALVLLYDALAKRHPLGTVVMGGCRYGNWLLGLSVDGLAAGDGLLPLPVLAYVAGLTALSRVETHARQRGPVYLAGAAMVAAFLAAVALNGVGLLPNTWALLPLALALVWVLWRLAQVLRDYTPARVQQAVMTLVLGVIPLDALLVLAGGPWWGAVVVLVLLIPGRLLARRLYVT
jgi:4-hydroxybenzoate polyprenyltransferase